MKVAVRVEFTLDELDVMGAVETIENMLKVFPDAVTAKLVSATPVTPVVHQRIVTEELGVTDP